MRAAWAWAAPALARGEPGASRDYLRGYRDAVNELVGRMLGGAGIGATARGALPDESEFTWGLQTTKVSSSALTGAGIKVAGVGTEPTPRT